MTTLFSVIICLAALLLILVVYIQNPKGGGLSSDFGSPTQLGGVKQTTEFIDKLTWGLATTIVVSAIIMSLQQPKPQTIKKTNPQSQQAPAKDAPNAPQGGR
ncbi:MAG: preprotein translocase subunit SecG [Bacteroidetes bacterium]|nr:preprotein translocase subunit SecG [Bacteroidota bacterium]MBM3423980.1 preprotein translocase subunit SecG [Bacteroidota bacterium]